MVGTTKTLCASETASSYLRKIRKPMVEKHRRERMNSSISQLKMLIAQTIMENTVPMTRIDKADILELTVYHLQKIQQQQRSDTMATELTGYSTGFKDCVREVDRFLSVRSGISDSTVGCLNNHLQKTYQMTSQHFHGNTTHVEQGINQGQMNRLSTPIRHDNVSSYLPDISQFNYSPIQDGLQTSFSSLLSHSGQSSGYCMSDSSTQDSGLSTSSYDYHDSESYTSSSSGHQSDIIKVKQEIVTIGTGDEDEIGHVISEAPWRPW